MVCRSGRKIVCPRIQHMLCSASYLAVQRHGHTRHRTNAEKSKGYRRRVQRQRRDQTGGRSPAHAGTRLAHPPCRRLWITQFHYATPGGSGGVSHSPEPPRGSLDLLPGLPNTLRRDCGVVQLPTGKGLSLLLSFVMGDIQNLSSFGESKFVCFFSAVSWATRNDPRPGRKMRCCRPQQQAPIVL